MSTPISACQVIKAAKGDEEVFQRLVEAMDYNMAHGAYTIFPCQHTPRCPKPTEEEMRSLDERMLAAIAERRRAARAKAPQHKIRFDRPIAPVIKNMASMPNISDVFTQDDHAKKRAPKHD